MTKPALVIMAAGMGSRYGGLKQIDPIGSQWGNNHGLFHIRRTEGRI